MRNNNQTNFNSMLLKIASPEEILSWSHGEVLKPETINYRTQKYEKDGLFAENIFGPSKDFECYCGKYKRVRYKNIICDKCNVEITKSSVRRERMGHIKLAASVTHIWFLRVVPSKIGLVLDMSVNDLEKVIYFAAYIVTDINEEERKKFFKETKDKKIKDELKNLHKTQILSELIYRDYSLKFGQIFKAKIGAEGIKEALADVNLKNLAKEIEKDLSKKKITEASNTRIKKMRRLRIIRGMIKTNVQPEWMCLDVLPVISPDLRPMVQLDGGRFATSDLNDLYRRIINRNNRLKRLIELGAPEVICRNEKRMLQEAVDALIDNASRHSQTQVSASTGGRRSLNSLADMLRGKQGRFRQNLLGKRVDYSGRSVIVSGPNLKLHQCGLPKKMALELFKPFVIHKLINLGMSHNVRTAGKLIEQETNEVWDLLEEVIQEKYVLLNRAPTLHRLGVQAFQPILIEGQAIQLHPLVCPAFNADFDGDQMAVHVPLSKNAQKEAREIMSADKNFLKPATGDPIVNPSKDIVWGCYYMTKIQPGLKGENKIFNDFDEAILAYQFEHIDLKAKIKIRGTGDTCVGRIIINQEIPENIEFCNEVLDKSNLSKLIAQVLNICGQEQVVIFLDKIKELGFHYSTISGLSWSMDDLKSPKQKDKLIKRAEKKVEQIENYFKQGLLTDDERYSQVISIWAELKGKLGDLIKGATDPYGAVYSMVDSKARGSWELINQMSGMKGLVVNPAGRIIELPIKNNLKQGFGILEYFIATHGTRKGMADTAVRTAAAGYLTRRLVDVSQDVIVREKDCKTKKYITIYRKDCEAMGESLSDRLAGRVTHNGNIIDKIKAQELEQDKKIQEIKVRSVITCETRRGVCQKCYGYDLGKMKIVELKEAIGIVTAQAIGEPGTQLTLRTFHSGGVAGGSDITQGLPRIEELFEARVPKGEAIISEIDGKVAETSTDKDGQKIITIKSPKIKAQNYKIPKNYTIFVKPGDEISKAQPLCEGSIDPNKLFALAGPEAVYKYITAQVQAIYSAEGANINDKHIELIVRQMLSRVQVQDPGDTDLLPGNIIERDELTDANFGLRKGKKKAIAQDLLLGITKVSLTTESWLSAASFQETARVLVDAAIMGKEDKLRGLKENVIIGKLIPAGTGL